ncbi:MAG: 50S ribosomal protein L11 methyltransferase [Calditrichaeota bacterium]|nr:MAG: 50S ribosomal protein L11 methyltransferase [Calditrichota bacterium]
MKPTHFYHQVTIETSTDVIELVNLSLFELGAMGLVETEKSVTAFFSDAFSSAELSTSISRRMSELQQAVDMPFLFRMQIEQFPERDWNAEWKSAWKPLRVGHSLMIKPSWLPMPKDAPPVVIEIDPEMAFGSGDHSTTQLMLQMIEKNSKSQDRILDIGTGTGILSIAARKLGCGIVIAFDVDQIASVTCKKNAMMNGIHSHFHIFTGMISALKPTKFDLIAANVNRFQILAMLPQLPLFLKDDGICLISGILDSEEDQIRQACHAYGLLITDMQKDKEWLAFETRKE